MPIVAVAGRKGGVGKSTITANLAAEFAALQQRVFVLDADPQHSLVAWASQGEGLLSRCVEPVDGTSPERFRATVREAGKHADRVLIDTPPGYSDTAFLAALVADLVLLPCGPSPLDLFPLKDILNMVLKARAQRGTKRPRIRFVPSKVLLHTNLGRELPGNLSKLGKKVLPGVSQRVAVAEAVQTGLTVREYAPGSPAQLEFEALAKAVEKVLLKK